MILNDNLACGQDPDRTVLMPPSCGRRPPSTTPSTPTPVNSDEILVALIGDGLNPLVCAANALLNIVVPLRMTPRAPDIEALRERLVQAIQQFEAQARNSRVDSQTIAASRYALCTLVDETISSTPWGSGAWSHRSLLVSFHNEAWGGERFFLILQRLSQDPRTHLDVLELMYLCLALGLEGRYRVLDRGFEQLTVLRERLLQLIRQQRGVVEHDLSPRWRGVATPPRSMLRVMPVWILAAVAAVLLLTLQLTLNGLLNRDSDPVFARMGEVRLTSPLKVAVPPAPAPVRLSGLLEAEVAQGMVSLKETADRSVITLHGDSIFSSGSADVSSSFESLIARIGDALNSVPGDVVVVGHTDNVRPSLSSRLSSNFHLSKSRARTVVRMLAERAGPAARYRSEGRGETEPLVPNDSATNRARNRRVEISVLIPAQSQ